MNSSSALVLASFMCVACEIHAGRPLIVDDAEAVVPWTLAWELGAGFVGDGPLQHGTSRSRSHSAWVPDRKPAWAWGNNTWAFDFKKTANES